MHQLHIPQDNYSCFESLSSQEIRDKENLKQSKETQKDNFISTKVSMIQKENAIKLFSKYFSDDQAFIEPLKTEIERTVSSAKNFELFRLVCTQLYDHTY